MNTLNFILLNASASAEGWWEMIAYFLAFIMVVGFAAMFVPTIIGLFTKKTPTT